jgi:hypothetical protein
VFRFFRRSRYSESAALKLMTESLLWRLRTDLASLSLSSLHPIYVDPPAARPPLFWAHPRFVDRYGRPCGVISLRSLERANSNSLDECREYIVACMESVRRHLAHVYARESAARDGKEGAEGAPPPFQMVIAISLLSSGMANLEMELLPFLLDLLKNHFPGMVGAVYVLHYGWVHAGMWGLAKRVLPEQALSRIFFPSNKELAEEHFDPSALPAEFGGDWEVELTEGTNEMMRKYAKPARSASGPPGSPPLHATRERPALSRTGSFESALDEYHSVAPSVRRMLRVTCPPADILSTALGISRSDSAPVWTSHAIVRAHWLLHVSRRRTPADDAKGSAQAAAPAHDAERARCHADGLGLALAHHLRERRSVAEHDARCIRCDVADDPAEAAALVERRECALGPTWRTDPAPPRAQRALWHVAARVACRLALALSCAQSRLTARLSTLAARLDARRGRGSSSRRESRLGPQRQQGHRDDEAARHARQARLLCALAQRQPWAAGA